MLLNLRKYKKICQKINKNKPVFIPKLDPKNGKSTINILFVNERPGPKTKETEMVSFDNLDPSVKLFKHLFCKTFGKKYRQHIFITNAVIWVPNERKAKNYKPTLKQLKNGINLGILEDQIKKINPNLLFLLGIVLFAL